MTTLIIAEKPSVARGIAEAVGARTRKDGCIEGNGYVVSWCRGHLVEYDYPDAYEDEGWGAWDLDNLPMIPDVWRMSVGEDEQGQYDALAGLMARPDVDTVVNACDADREGESIFRRVYGFAGCTKPVRRFWSTSLVPEQVMADLKAARPQSDYDGLADAAEGRAKADWLVGMNASRALSCTYRGSHLSAGRVQTPTLALIVARTRQIEGFRSSPFYQAVLGLAGFEAYGDRLDSADEARARAEAAVGGLARVTSLERKVEHPKAPTLYDLTLLQRDASTVCGMTAADTLATLQGLYEKKLTTYPRTESRFVTEADIPDVEAALALASTPEVAGAAVAGAFVPSRADASRVANDDKVHGHGAILPTRLLDGRAMASLRDNERKVASLIVSRLLAAVMDPATRTKVRLACEVDGNVYRASGSSVQDASWLAVDEAMRATLGSARRAREEPDQDSEQPIPDDLSQGDEVEIASARVKDGKTCPPKPYTDDTLLSAMENAGRSIDDRELRDAINDDTMHSGGLGTPATRASTIEELVARGYACRKGKSILATERGCALVDVVCDSLKTPELTARWELELSRVERGETNLPAFLSGIEGYTAQVVADAKASFDPAKAALVCDRVSVGACPACGAPVYKTKSGKSYRCSASEWAGPEEGYRLLSGDGFNLSATQCRKRITDAQAAKLVAGERVRICGLKKKDGSTFDAVCEVGPAPYSGFVTFVHDGGKRGPSKGGAKRGRAGARRGGKG